jgi:hypothetical protein
MPRTLGHDFIPTGLAPVESRLSKLQPPTKKRPISAVPVSRLLTPALSPLPQSAIPLRIRHSSFVDSSFPIPPPRSLPQSAIPSPAGRGSRVRAIRNPPPHSSFVIRHSDFTPLPARNRNRTPNRNRSASPPLRPPAYSLQPAVHRLRSSPLPPPCVIITWHDSSLGLQGSHHASRRRPRNVNDADTLSKSHGRQAEDS